MGSKSFKKKIRKFIPFPKRRTLKLWFPDYWVKNNVHLINQKNINLVIDVGANIGQYGKKLRSAGYTGRIVSFEPQSFAWNELAKAAKNDSAWTVAPQMALGASKGELELNILKDHSLSSFLTPLDGNTESEVEVLDTEIVPVDRLDDVIEQYIEPGDQILLKIDVQGFEKMVFEGALTTLSKSSGVQLELALSPMYDGESYYIGMLNFLKKHGFALCFIAPVISRLKLGPWTQFDGLFFREDFLNEWGDE